MSFKFKTFPRELRRYRRPVYILGINWKSVLAEGRFRSRTLTVIQSNCSSPPSDSQMYLAAIGRTA